MIRPCSPRLRTAYAVAAGAVLGSLLSLMATYAGHTTRTENATPVVVQDAQTGCEYLSTPGGGLTPRLLPSGRQMCEVKP